MRLWVLETAALLHTLEGHEKVVKLVAWSCNGTKLASGSQDGAIRLWQVDLGAHLRSYCGHTNWILSLAWSADDKKLVSTGSDKTV